MQKAPFTQSRTETRCEKTELFTSQCAHCRGLDSGDAELLAHRRQLLRQRRKWFAATYPGTCTGCGDWYSPGTAISRDGTGWRAECCSESEDE